MNFENEERVLCQFIYKAPAYNFSIHGSKLNSIVGNNLQPCISYQTDSYVTHPLFSQTKMTWSQPTLSDYKTVACNTPAIDTCLNM